MPLRAQIPKSYLDSHNSTMDGLIHTNKTPKSSSQHPLCCTRLHQCLKNLKKNFWIMWKKSIFLLFSNFWLQTPMVPAHGTGKFCQYLGHYLPPKPSTFTRIKILILCTILLCSVHHILIQKETKNSILTFDQHKTSSEGHQSNQSPILKFSPSNCLHFLNIHLQQKSTISKL